MSKEENFQKRHAAKERTLRLKKPLGYTIGLALLLLATVIVLFELAARSEVVREALPAPSLGIGHRFLDLKLHYLAESVKKEGPVDCIFIGSSIVAADIDPVVFGKSLQKITGQWFHSFNMGIAGLSFFSNKMLTEMLVRLYRPKLIVLGLTAAEFHGETIPLSETRIATNPWIRRQLGYANFKGWLTEHFFSYRYFLRFRQWMEWPKFSNMVARKEKRLSPYGFSNFGKKRPLVVKTKQKLKIINSLKNFTLSQKRIHQFEEIMDFHTRGEVALVVVEMPLHPRFYTFFPGGKKDHIKAINHVARRTKKRGVPFITLPPDQFSADCYWREPNHMNAEGAEKFSQWLGEQIGKSVEI